MKERPILFSAPMVRAILSGHKTQTRRIVKPHPQRDEVLGWQNIPQAVLDYCPYGDGGDELWVRESTEKYLLPNILTGEPTDAEGGLYTADQAPALFPTGFDIGWWYSRKSCPSIHMPRHVSRIQLRITGIRVERLQDISNADALAEGIEEFHGRPYTGKDAPADGRQRYAELWEKINGKGSWATNPWVWVIEFERIKP